MLGSLVVAQRHLFASPCKGLIPTSAITSTLNWVKNWQAYHSGHLQVQIEPLAGDHEGISVLSLNRAEARNAIGRQFLRELQECINNLRQERSTRCVIVRSSVPSVFSSGADLKERATMTQQETAEFVTSLRRTFLELESLPMPTIAAVEGYCLGGGAELAISCDFRVCSHASEWGFPEVTRGIMPGAGGTQRLPRLLGISKAKELVFTGRHVRGTEAAAIGLADHVVEDGHAYGSALDLAARVCKGAPIALRMAKAAIHQGAEVDLHTGMKLEEILYSQLLPTKDRVEGILAFAEKRTPRFKGE